MFILGPDVHWRLYFNAVASDTRVHATGRGQRSKLRTFETLVFQVFLVHIWTATIEARGQNLKLFRLLYFKFSREFISGQPLTRKL